MIPIQGAKKKLHFEDHIAEQQRCDVKSQTFPGIARIKIDL
jgi:hypothetical protein